jgi:hypothetical protein
MRAITRGKTNLQNSRLADWQIGRLADQPGEMGSTKMGFSLLCTLRGEDRVFEVPGDANPTLGQLARHLAAASGVELSTLKLMTGKRKPILPCADPEMTVAEAGGVRAWQLRRPAGPPWRPDSSVPSCRPGVRRPGPAARQHGAGGGGGQARAEGRAVARRWGQARRWGHARRPPAEQLPALAASGRRPAPLHLSPVHPLRSELALQWRPPAAAANASPAASRLPAQGGQGAAGAGELRARGAAGGAAPPGLPHAWRCGVGAGGRRQGQRAGGRGRGQGAEAGGRGRVGIAAGRTRPRRLQPGGARPPPCCLPPLARLPATSILYSNQSNSPASRAPEPPSGDFCFQRYQVLQLPGLSPPPSQALKLLYRWAPGPPGRQGKRARRCAGGAALGVLPQRCAPRGAADFAGSGCCRRSSARPGPRLRGLQQRPPRLRASPPPCRIAADPGISGVMAAHQWRVGLLSEMPPEGKVGISAVCVLGFNVNQGQVSAPCHACSCQPRPPPGAPLGPDPAALSPPQPNTPNGAPQPTPPPQEISLRLRTDDLRGFRKYARIRETLVHELAHMVHSEHDSSFKALNSQVRAAPARVRAWRGAAPPCKSSLGAGAARCLGGRLLQGGVGRGAREGGVGGCLSLRALVGWARAAASSLPRRLCITRVLHQPVVGWAAPPSAAPCPPPLLPAAAQGVRGLGLAGQGRAVAGQPGFRRR